MNEQTGYLRVVPTQIVDGYNIPFSPAMHAAFVRDAEGDKDFVTTIPDIPVYSGESFKDRPAGWYDKSSKMDREKH